MENSNLNVTLKPGNNNVAEAIIRTGVAPKMYDVLPPVPQQISGTISAVSEYLDKRVNAGQFAQTECYILVDREDMSITLIINDKDPYTLGKVKGEMKLCPKFVEFGINDAKAWAPVELGLFIKMNRAAFPSRDENMKLVSTLMNYTATINQKVERGLRENGSRTDNFSQVVNSNLPASFHISIPVFKGMSPVYMEVETIARVDGREVSFVLLSPGAQEVLDAVRNNIIDEQLALIRGLAPDIAIIEQ